MHSSIRREQKKVHLSMSRIFNHQKRRIPHIKPTCAFYEFGPEKKKSMRNSVPISPSRLTAASLLAAPYSILETISSPSAQTSAGILWSPEKRILYRMLTAVVRPAMNTSSTPPGRGRPRPAPARLQQTDNTQILHYQLLTVNSWYLIVNSWQLILI